MNRLKTVALGGVALVVGAVTLRRLRNRGTDAEPATPAEAAGEEASAAARHAKDALLHAGAAAGFGLEAVRSRSERERSESEPAEVGSRPARRLRRVGKGWIRR